MKRIAVILAAVIAAFASNGIRPRGSPADYPAHATSEGVTIAAAVVPPAQVRKIFSADLNSGGYIVIEVAVYPESAPDVDVSSGDFMLSPAGETSAVPPVSARTIAGVFDRKNSSPRGRDTNVDVAIGYETGNDPVTGQRRSGTYTGVAVENGPQGTLAPPPSGPDPWTIKQELEERSLPERKSIQPVAGYLYFPKLKKSRSAGYELTYYGVSNKVRLTIPAAK
jgi:hypothetical protein